MSENWSGRLAFVLASVGAAVGLGNIWKFPYTAGSSGGSAFVLVYVLAILFVATPIMLSEMIIGRRTKKSAPTAMADIAAEVGASPRWTWLGWIGLFAVFLVISFYSVIAGWTGAYLVKSISGSLAGLTPEEVGASFGGFLNDPLPMMGWQLLFLTVAVLVVMRGVRDGLERVVKLMMPALFLTLIGLVFYSAYAGNFAEAVGFLFSPDIGALTAPVVLAAVGQAFFSVNVGIGTVLTYSAYLPKDVNLFRSALTISAGDTLVALLAGLAVFPIVFAYQLDPGEGPGLVFVTLATAFAQMPGGAFVGAAFFTMLLFAALTSAIAMLETIAARLVENGGSRPRAVIAIAAAAFVVGLITVLSFSSWSGVHPLGAFDAFVGKTPFDLIDYLVSNVIMPLGGVLFALFAGWRLSKDQQVAELGVGDGGFYHLWLICVRYLAPLAVLLVFYFNLF